MESSPGNKWISFHFYLILLLLSTSLEAVSYKSFDKIHGSKVSPEVQAQAVNDLIQRLIPERANEFRVQIEDAPSNEINGYFEITKQSGDNVVFIKGSTGVMAAWGFHYYLTQHCHCHISWDYDQLNLPADLPDLSVRISSNDQFRYYQNVCTVSYSSPWWQWPRWQREIDWMAMNGINLPLAFMGQEVIWQRVYLSLGLDQQDIDQHFAGPAFLAWQRMGNLRRWGGSLSDSWQQQTLSLQHKILERMRSFGMIPVLPAFAGHIPRAFERIYPEANYTHLTPWLGFEDDYCCPSFLQPTEPLFTEIGSRFMQEMINEFGTNHMYNCDVFNEMRPTQSEPSFIGQVSEAVYKAMTVVDPHAVWVMQAWLFKYDASFWTPSRAEALLTSVPLGKMLILDLQAELEPQYLRFKSFYGQPFIFCLLHNFGGVLGLYGTVPTIAQHVIDGRKFENSTMIGTGLTMEGINQNYVVYDYMLEMGWRNETSNLDNWYDQYSIRRYGANDSYAIKGWRLLQRSVYNGSSDVEMHEKLSILSMRPSLDHDPILWYDPTDVNMAWYEFIQASSNPILRTSLNFQHDLIDVTRQALQEEFNALYIKLVKSYRCRNSTVFRETAANMIDVLEDMDSILKTGSKYLLGKWISDARSWGLTEMEKTQYEWNARNQITLWGPKGEILDYATKQWNGMVGDYYKPRWKTFIDELQSSLDSGKRFNQTVYNNDVFTSVEEPFTFSTKKYPDIPSGDPVLIARSLHEKWGQTVSPSFFKPLSALLQKFRTKKLNKKSKF